MSKSAVQVAKRISSLIRTNANDLWIRSPKGSFPSELYVTPLVEAYASTRSGLPTVLVIVPTKDGADRVSNAVHKVRDKNAILVTTYGGGDKALTSTQFRKGCDYVVATPGRIDWFLTSTPPIMPTEGLRAVVLEEADVLLSNAAVVKFMTQSLSNSVQRILCASHIDEWLNDTVREVTRTGHSLDVVSVNPVDVPAIQQGSPMSGEHKVSRTNANDELRHLRYVVDASAAKRVVVYCRSNAEALAFGDEPILADWLVLSGDMSAAVRKQQIAKFANRDRGVLLTTDSSLGPDIYVGKVDLVVHMGVPKDPSVFVARTSRSQGCKSYVILRSKEYETFTKRRSRLPILFQPAPVPSQDDLAVSLLHSIRRSIDTAPDALQLSHASDLLRLYGDGLLAGLTSLMESRKHLLEKRSLLSGTPGYSPVLLFDPFMKKIKTYQDADNLVKGCLSNADLKQGGKIGRIALTAKGFVVDVPIGWVSQVVESKKLRQRNIKAILLKELPPLVTCDRLSSASRVRRDKQQVARLTKRATLERQ